MTILLPERIASPDLQPARIIWRNHYILRSQSMVSSHRVYKHKRSAVRYHRWFFRRWHELILLGHYTADDDVEGVTGSPIPFREFVFAVALPEKEGSP